jgi:putative ABC transport system permease protein
VKRVAASVFDAALRLYPSSFRDEYGIEMRRALGDSLENTVGSLEAVLVWLNALTGVLIEAPKEHCWLMVNDLRYALRTLRQARWFTTTALVSLALGIGANTAIFSVVESVLLQQLPYDHPDRILMVWVTNPQQGFDHDVTSYPRLEDWRARSRTIEEFAAYSDARHVLTGTGEPEHVRGAAVTANFFRVMGAQATLGRTFLQGDDVFGRPRIAVLSRGFWARRFGGDPAVVGRAITLDGRPYTIIGVMPSTFRYPSRDVDLWEPLAASPDVRSQRDLFWLTTVARLAPGVTLRQAQEEMNAVSRRLAAEHTRDQGLGVDLVRLQDELTANTRPALLLLTAAVAFVLLIACANVAGMLSARASDRQLEFSLRAALGAGRGRVVRQLLTESVLLFVLGGALGLALAAAGERAIVRLAPATLAEIRDASIDWRVALYALGVAALTGLVFGAAPAMHASRLEKADAIRCGSLRVSAHRGAAWFRTGLLAAQVALAFVLLTGAGLLLRSFAQMQAVDLGFDPHNVVAARISLPPAGYDNDAKTIAFHDALAERLRSTPGIDSVAGITTLLLDRLPNSAGFQIEGRAQDITMPLTYDSVTPGLFRTMKIPLVRGRYFTDADGDTTERVAIINEATARKYWPNQDPVGQRFRFGGGADNKNRWWTIVGVVKDTRRAGLDVPVFTESYQPLRQAPSTAVTVLVRTENDDAAIVAPALRRAVRELDPRQPVSSVTPVQALVDDTLAGRRFNTLLVTIFALTALVLAAVGVYGLLAYMIGQRHREIGIRIALGAPGVRIVRAVGGRAMAAACGGAVVGVLLSIAVHRAISGMLFDVVALDPATYLGAALLLAVVIAVAAVFPIRRALNVDPAVSLRSE